MGYKGVPDETSIGLVRAMIRTLAAKHISIFGAGLCAAIIVEQLIRGENEWPLYWFQVIYGGGFTGVYFKIYPLKRKENRVRLVIMAAMLVFTYSYTVCLGAIPMPYLIAGIIFFVISARYSQYLNKRYMFAFAEYTIGK